MHLLELLLQWALGKIWLDGGGHALVVSRVRLLFSFILYYISLFSVYLRFR